MKKFRGLDIPKVDKEKLKEIAKKDKQWDDMGEMYCNCCPSSCGDCKTCLFGDGEHNMKLFNEWHSKKLRKKKLKRILK